MENLKSPKLRFPEFTEAWGFEKLGEVAKINRGKSKHRPRNASILYGGDYPFIQTGDIKEAGLFLTKYTQTYSEAGLKQSKLWDIDTLCITIAANIAETSILKIKACFPDSIIGLIPKADKTIVLFVKHQFDKYKLEIQRLSQGAAQDNLNQEKLSDIQFYFPSLPEQTKIASFLTAVDEKLHGLKAKKALLERYKKGVMQQLFSRQLRFKDDNGQPFPDWEEKKLGEVLFEHLEKNKGNKYKEVFSVAKHKGVINQVEHLGRSFSAKEIAHYKVINLGDLVYTKSPTSDFPFGIIKQNRTERAGVVSPLYCVMKPITFALGYLIHEYFASSINTFNYLKPLVQKGAKNTMNINNDDFLNGAKIKLPMNEIEQTKIANFLFALDEKITGVQQRLEKGESWKRGLLQQLFV